jgi:hypothetical protein
LTKFLLEVQGYTHELLYIQDKEETTWQSNCSEQPTDLVVLRAGRRVVWILADPSPTLAWGVGNTPCTSLY